MSEQVVFDQTSLGLGTLTVGAWSFGASYWFAEDGFAEPEFDETLTNAEQSPNLGGSLTTQAVSATGTLALTVWVQGTSGDDLKAKKRALEAAVRQFSYTVAVTVTGAADTYTCNRGRISWGTVNAAMVRANLARCVITIPVQPLGA